jgi:Holliday junction resolvase
MTNYRRGADKERRIVNQARKKGLTAFRSAGSHSIFDGVIIDIEKKEIEFFQSKTYSKEMILKDGTPTAEALRILEEIKKFEGVYNVRCSLR